jgi:RNA polymerase sigma-70 factor (ECF subfamily)
VLEIAQRDRQLQLALAKLSDGQRQIIVLRDYMDLSYAEIAVALEIARGTVMSRLHRARLALKEEMISHG